MNFYPKKKKNGYWACIDKSPRIQLWYNNIYIYDVAEATRKQTCCFLNEKRN